MVARYCWAHLGKGGADFHKSFTHPDHHSSGWWFVCYLKISNVKFIPVKDLNGNEQISYLVISPTAIAYIYAMFDCIPHGRHSFCAVVLPMWTTSSPKGVQNNHTAAPVKTPELSGPCLRNLHSTPAQTGTLQNLPEPASGTYTSTHQNSPEPSGARLRNLHQHTPEPSGTFLRNL